MLAGIFKEIINLSLSGALVAAVIMLIKLSAGRRLPVRFHSALWLILVVKLILPFNIQSSFSMSNILPPFMNSVVSPITDTDDGFTTSYNYNAEEIQQGSDEVISGNINISDDNSSDYHTSQSDTPTINFDKKSNNSQNYLITDTAQQQAIDLWTVAAYIWLTGTLLMVLILIFSYLKTWYMLRQRAAVNEQGINSMLESCRRETGVKCNIKVVSADGILSPFVFGLLSPTIVLPSGLTKTLDDTQLKSVLLHEINHIKRHDPLFRLVIAVLQAIHWFNPVLWFAFDRIGKDIECACDDSVIRNYDEHERTQYAAVLYCLAESKSRRKGITMLPAFGESNIKRRIVNIMKWRKHSIISIIASVMIILLAAVFMLPEAVGNANEPALGGQNQDNEAAQPTNPTFTDETDVSKETEPDTDDNGIPAALEDDLGTQINLLLDRIVGTGSPSSNPYDYIKGNVEFDKLVALGEPALERMFELFSQDHEDGLREYVMASACAKILGVFDEEEGIRTTSGREWFFKYMYTQQDQLHFVDADYDIFRNSGNIRDGFTLPDRTDKTNIEEVISDYLTARFRAGFYPGEKALEVHHIYRIEEKDGVISAYMLVRSAGYEFQDGKFVSIGGTGGIPIRMDMMKSADGRYEVISYKEPMDGGLYLSSIKEMFPDDLVKIVTDRNELVKKEEEQARALMEKASEYVKSIGREGAVVSGKYSPGQIDEGIKNAIYQVTEMKREFPDWIGTREALVKVGGPYPGLTVRCIMETNVKSGMNGEYIVTLTRSWDMNINGSRPVSVWRYKVAGNKVTLIEEHDEDYMVTTIE